MIVSALLSGNEWVVCMCRGETKIIITLMMMVMRWRTATAPTKSMFACCFRIPHCRCRRRHRTVGPNPKNPPKMRFIKFVKLTGYIMPPTVWQILNLKDRKRKSNEFVETCLAKLWNHIKWPYYWRVLAIWNHCASVLACLLKGNESS